MLRIKTITLLVAACLGPALAQSTPEGELAKDVVLRAMVDELERATSELSLADFERPYFIEYALSDSVRGAARAQLGALTDKSTYRSRSLRCDVRVGSYKLDNTNFSGDSGGFDFGGMGGFFGAEAPIPIEDDYDVIRQGIWWATDRKYKTVVEEYAKKNAFMEGKVIEDKPDDFSRETPVTNFEPRVPLNVDLNRLETIAIELSQLFKSYSSIKTSGVSLSMSAENHYIVNNEGTRLRTATTSWSFAASASVQSDDGMEFSDSVSVLARTLEDLPPIDELGNRCRAMVDQLIAVKDAPKLDSYTGPVLFEPRAAAVVFSSGIANRLAGGQRPVGSRTTADDFANKLGKRILPRFLSVMDDPTRSEIAGAQALGHFTYDDQGVVARPVQLVENGRLKALVMSRNPSKEFGNSTGHGRGAWRPRAATANVFVTANPATNPDGLREDLREACQDEDLPFGIRVVAMSAQAGVSRFDDFAFPGFDFDSFSRGRSAGEMPLVMYKVFADGHEELVRGAEIARIDLKAFKRILAAGDTPYVLNSDGGSGRTVCVPALLFEELDLAKIDRDFDKPPILASPLARAK